MGLDDDLENMYVILDSPYRGFVDSRQIQDFHQTLFSKKIGPEQVEAALKDVCGGKLVCTKKQFVPLLLELERRRTIEERAWWDFKSLDVMGADRISIQDTLFLFTITLGDRFTMGYWGEFMLSRNYSKEAASFEDIKMWLCKTPPDSTTVGLCPDTLVFEEIDKLQAEKNKADYRNYKKIKTLQNDDFIQTLDARVKQQYQDKFRQGAKRKLNRWLHLGVESMLFDDGLDVGNNLRDHVTVQDLLEAMDEKYDILREKLIWESLQQHVGDAIWNTMTESEQEEQVLKIKTKHQRLVAQNEPEKVTQLSISSQNYDSRLVSLMGYHRERQIQLMEDSKENGERMRTEGKSEEEIAEVLAKEYSEQIKGNSTCGELLIDLQRRYMSEREFLVAVLKGVQGRVLFSAEMVSEYVLYVQQQILASREGEGFEHATLVTGLSERPQEFKSDRFDADRDRHEKLALERLQRFGGKRPNRVKEGMPAPDVKYKGIVDMQIEIMRVLLKKHYQEKNMMLYLLKGKESGTWRSVARRRDPDAREERRKDLRLRQGNWRQLNSRKMAEERTRHLKILFEGMGIYHETRRSEVPSGGNLNDQQVSAVVLADLQQIQAQEVERTLLDMQHKSSNELLAIWQQEHAAWSEEWLDNISAIFFGSFQLSEEEQQIARLLKDKYESLREKLFYEMLVREFGLAAVWRMTDEERDRQLARKKHQEKTLKQDGKLDELEEMFAPVTKDKESFTKLVGNLRVLKQKQIHERLATRKADERLNSGSETDSDADNDVPVEDLLSNIQLRSDRELDVILAMLGGRGAEKFSQSEKSELQLRLHLEQMRAQAATEFTSGALVMGLTERAKINCEMSSKSDQRRYDKLANERFRIRQSIRDANLTEPIDKEEKMLPPKGDMMAWRLSVLSEVLKTHRCEREILLSIMMDKGSDDLRDAAKQMTQEEREQRLNELRMKAEGLNLDQKGDNEANQDILEEAGAIKCVLRKQSLELKTERVVGQEEVSISLLANLQEIQDKEIEKWIDKMYRMSEEDLSKLRMEYIWARQQSAGRNVLIAFTQYDGAADEDSLIKALRKKYAFLKDKALLDLLRKQIGEAKWAELSERERQKKLMKLKLEEKRLRREGKDEELKALLGGFLDLELHLHKLMGDNRAEYEDKLKKRLQARKKRQMQGLENEDEGGLSEDEELSEVTSSNPLDDLQQRFEQERDSILAKLRGAEKQYLSEKERQAELARLKRELRRAQKEDDFAAAALVLGLSERNQAAAEQRLKNDRQRQEELARMRLEAARNRKKTLQSIQEGVDDTIVDNGDRAVMQDAVLRALEQKHLKERETLVLLLQTESSEDDRLVAENMSSEQRTETMQQLQQDITKLAKSQSDERFPLLLEATLLKVVSRTIFLSKQEERSEVNQDVTMVTIMADLQDQQDKESEALLEKLVDKENSYLIRLQQELIDDTKCGLNENVTLVVTTPDFVKKSDDEELVEALDDKYDALRDKILAEALMNQVGAKEWAQLSEKERQAKLIKLRLQERKLRQEGNFEEAAALLGDAAKNQAALAALMGMTRKSQEERLRERLEKRKQRIAEGMTEEEAKELEEKETKEEEEEMNKTSVNILEELEKRKLEEKNELLSSLEDKGEEQASVVENKYDALRDKVLAEALMKQMGDADWAKLSERERQAKLMQLRLQERKLRQEGKVDEAAALLGDSVKVSAALALMKEEQRRERDRRLKERLAKRKQRLAEGMTDDEVTKLEKAEAEKDEEELMDRDVNVMEAIDNAENEYKEIQIRKKGELEKEIEDKYNDLQDKLLAELLMKQLGAADYAKLSERERQAMILKLKLAERRERMAGRHEEAATLMKDLENSQKALELLREAARQERERQLRDRLTARRKRIAAGMTLEESMKLEEQEQQDERKADQPENVMQAIDTLMTEEKYSLLQKYCKPETDRVEDKYDEIRDKMLTEVLIKQMSDGEWSKLAEAEKQARKLQLRLVERRMRREGDYDKAASIMGEAVRTERAVDIMMEAAKKKQAQRLRDQLELRQKRMEAGISQDEIIQLETEDTVEEAEREEGKKENVMEALEILLDEERSDLLSNLKKPDKEAVLKELEKKYDQIRNKILTDVLIKQMSDADWVTLSEAERQSKKVELKLKEREMRRLNQWEEAATLLGGAARTEVALQVIKDAARRSQEQKVRDKLEKRKQRLGAGLTDEEIEKLEKDEEDEEEEENVAKKENVMEAIETLLQEEKSDALAQFRKRSPDEEAKAMQKNYENLMDQILAKALMEQFEKRSPDKEAKAMQKNYENLMDQILAKALMEQMGKAEWSKLSERDRQGEMMKLRMKERQLRQEGRVDEAAALLGEAAKSQAAMEAILGNAQKTQEEKTKEKLQKRKERIALGMTTKEVLALEAEETKEEEEMMKRVEKPKNVLEALDSKIEEEKAAILRNLRKKDERLMQERKRQAALAKLRREQRRARQEENFDAAALVIGLAQKADDAREMDRKRQEKLAKERLEQRKKQIAARKLARESGQLATPKEEGSPAPVPLPANASNKEEMQTAVVKEMEIRYQEERDLMVQILSDEESTERRDQAKVMTEDLRQKRLSDLKEQRRQWRESGPTMDDQDEHLDILSRAAALKLESRADDLRHLEGDPSDESVQVSILADLQEKQDEEAGILMEDLESKAIGTLKQLKQVQYIARSNAWCDNLATTLLETKANDDMVTEEKLVKALEGKYDVLRDKLLTEALIKQFGEEEWAGLTDKERQAKLMKVRLQERRLRKQGKFDEANSLIGQDAQNQKEMTNLLGETGQRQEERVAKREELKAQIRAQRESEGLDVSDEALNDAVAAQEDRLDALEEKQSKKNILEELNNHFEAEKAALLTQLRRQEDQYKRERERQLALAKLRREQRMLNDEGKFNAAAALFGLSQEHEKARVASVVKDRERQRQLARDRLAKMKARKTRDGDQLAQPEILERLRKEEVENQQLDAAHATTGAACEVSISGESIAANRPRMLQLADRDSELNRTSSDLLGVSNMEHQRREGMVGYQLSILEEVEKKHVTEREMLHQLLVKAGQDQKMLSHLQGLSDQELGSNMEALKYQRDTWKADTMAVLSYATSTNLTGEQLEQYLSDVASKQEEQFTLLMKALATKAEILLRKIRSKGAKSTEGDMQEELAVEMLADLQQKQTSENSALNTILSTSAEKGNEFLVQLKDSQRRARREGWLDNLAASLFSGAELEKSIDDVEEEEQSKLAALEAELEKEKEEALVKGKAKRKLGEDYDPDAAVAALEKQYAAKKQAMMAQLERQQKAAMKKLAARKARQEDKEYEDQAVMAMLQNAERQQARLEESTKEQKSKHSALMQARLAARREQRHLDDEKRQEEERKREAEKEQEEQDKTADEAATGAKAKAPFGGMQREKTVIDVDMSESQKTALFTALLKDHNRAQLKKATEQERYTEALQKRLGNLKNKQIDTAMSLIGIGERQKTKLELTLKEQRERQKTMVQDRVRKVKFERTQTMVRRQARDKKAFVGVLADETDTTSALTEDEKMARAAEKMQQNFMREQALYKAGEKPAMQPESDDALSTTSSSGSSKRATPSPLVRQKSVARILKAKDRERLLKNKRAERRRQKGQASSASAAPDMDSLAKMLEDRKNAASEATSTFTTQITKN